MSFANPLAFGLLIFLPFLFRRVSKKYRKFSSKPLLLSPYVPSNKLRPVGLKKYRDLILTLLLIAIFSFLVTALARPRKDDSFTEVLFKARDIMLVLDTSRSMEALDFSLEGKRVDRMTALKKVTKQFVASRDGDRIGMVVFGTDVFTQCPLTRDTKTILSFLDTIQPMIAGPSTAIGDAIAIGLKRIKDIETDSKVMILVTDGKNNAGTMDPVKASEVAKELGITIHVIGVGSASPAPLPNPTRFGLKSYRSISLEYDEETLKTIAKNTGGIYFNAQNTEQLENVYKQINQLEAREEKSKEFVNWQEHYKSYLLLALILMLFYEVLTLTIFMVVP